METISPLPLQEAGARRRLIVIDDDDAVRRSLQLLLNSRGYDVRSFNAAAPALADPGLTRTPFLVIDRRLPDGDGLALLDQLKRRGWNGRAILITGFPSSTLAAEARARGYDAVLEKPLRQHELLMAIGERP